MEQGIDNARFGAFVARLRKEKGLTQRQLAELVGVSDKAVSKWERGLSLPDISLLEPLAGTLGVTVAELLHGERLDAPLPPRQVEALVTGAVQLGQAQRPVDAARRLRWLGIWAGTLGIAAVEVVAAGWLTGQNPLALLSETAGGTAPLVLGLAGFAGLLFCLLEDQLPAYYDEYAVPGYMRGGFHLRVPGVRFTNRNWLPVRRAGFGVSVGVLAGYLPAVLVLQAAFPTLPLMFWPALSLTVLLGGLFGGISLAALRHAETPPTGRALAKALAWLVVLLVFIWGMYGGAAALTGYLAGGSWQGHALSGSSSQLFWFSHRIDGGWSAQYMAFTGYKTLQIAGEGTLTIEATTIAGNLTVQLTGPDGEVLLDETTDTDAVWQLDAPNAVQLTVIGKGHSGAVKAQYAGL